MSVYDERYHVWYNKNLNYYTSDPNEVLALVAKWDDASIYEGYGEVSSSGYTYRKNLGPVLASTLEFRAARKATLALLERLRG